MDAIGALSALGTLSSLIPNLKFVGAYSLANSENPINVPTWKFGIASLYGTVFQVTVSGGVDAVLTLSGLIAPNVRMQVVDGNLYCATTQLFGSRKTYAAAILFNY